LNKSYKSNVLQKKDQQLVFTAAAKPAKPPNYFDWMTTQNDRKNKTYKTLQLSFL
jgi:hypothetical protein